MKDDEVYYKFSFTSFNDIHNPHSNISNDSSMYSVLTNDIKKMQIFFKQHCFDDDCINYISIADAGDLDCNNELIEFKAKSNSSNDSFSILSTQEIVDVVLENVAQDYVTRIAFGYGILRIDIPIIELVHSLLYKVPHMFILEDELVDNNVDSMNRFGETDESDNSPNDSYDDQLQVICESMYQFNQNHIYVCESMLDLGNKVSLLPYTIEAYSKYFTFLMT